MSSRAFDSTWFVVKTKPRQEQRAKLNLENQSITTYLPMLNVERIKLGKRVQVVEPLFPSYMFVQLTNYNAQFHKVRSTFGVTDFIKFGLIPAQVNDDVIQTIYNMADSLNKINKSPELVNVGDKVEIVEGPFRGCMATILALEGDDRCAVLLDWLEQGVKAEFRYKDLRKS